MQRLLLGRCWPNFGKKPQVGWRPPASEVAVGRVDSSLPLPSTRMLSKRVKTAARWRLLWSQIMQHRHHLQLEKPPTYLSHALLQVVLTLTTSGMRSPRRLLSHRHHRRFPSHPNSPQGPKFIDFPIQGRLYFLQIMPFGLNLHPLIFTTVITPVLKLLHSQNISASIYIDDWLLWARDPPCSSSANFRGLGHLGLSECELAWHINAKKCLAILLTSCLFPSPPPQYSTLLVRPDNIAVP